MSIEDNKYIPKRFLKYQDHFIQQLWDEPEKSFLRALEYGYDPVVNTRHTKYLFYDKQYDASIKKVFKNGDHKWYSTSIRMSAYEEKHSVKWRDASEKGDFSSLTNE